MCLWLSQSRSCSLTFIMAQGGAQDTGPGLHHSAAHQFLPIMLQGNGMQSAMSSPGQSPLHLAAPCLVWFHHPETWNKWYLELRALTHPDSWTEIKPYLESRRCSQALQSTDPPELHYGPPAAAEIQKQHSLVKILSGSWYIYRPLFDL